MRRLIVWGAGELGGRVAAAWTHAGGPAIGLTKTTTRHAALQADGIETQIGAPVDLLQPTDVLLLAIPGHTNQQQAVEHLIDTQTPAPHRAVFISVTGYYGSPKEAITVIDEQTPGGESPRAHSIATAEQTFRQWAGNSGVILRAGGLYCLGRGPVNALAKRGYPRPGPSNKTMALIHYDDVAATVVAALQHPDPAAVYLTVMPPCPTRKEFYTAACEHLNLPPPEFEDPIPNQPVYYDVALLCRDLLPKATYPDWRAALNHL